jgi:catechol 2,3-dioxygenase-like lactoylglutathione lyase family enzyme
MVLRMIDCVMVRVGDLDEAAEFYARVFGLRRLWQDETAVGMGMPDTEQTSDVVVDGGQQPQRHGQQNQHNHNGKSDPVRA